MDELDIIKVFFILHHNTPVVPHFATPKLSEKVLRKGGIVAKRGKLLRKMGKIVIFSF